MSTSMAVILSASRDKASNDVPKPLMLHIPAPNKVTASLSGFPPSNVLSSTSFGFIASPFVPSGISYQTAILWIARLNSSRSIGVSMAIDGTS